MKIELVGRVCNGQGEGKQFLALPWVKAQINHKLGFKPYPGTLNLRLLPDAARQRKILIENNKLEICPSAGYCEGLLFGAWIANLKLGVIIPQVENYADDVLEVVSPLNLREKLRLSNGDQVTVNVDT